MIVKIEQKSTFDLNFIRLEIQIRQTMKHNYSKVSNVMSSVIIVCFCLLMLSIIFRCPAVGWMTSRDVGVSTGCTGVVDRIAGGEGIAEVGVAGAEEAEIGGGQGRPGHSFYDVRHRRPIADIWNEKQNT